MRHQWKIAFFSPENNPIVYHLRKLIEKLTGRRFQNGCGMTEGLLLRSEEFLAENVCHIALKGSATPERVLAKARELVLRRGCLHLRLRPGQPFRAYPRAGATGNAYLSNFLNLFTEFGHAI